MPNWCYVSVDVTHVDPVKIAEVIAASDTLCAHFAPVPGNADPYSWCIEHWGTKSEVKRVDVQPHSPTEVTLNFETAWSPPIPVFNAMRAQGYRITAEYFDEFACFVGRYIDGEDQSFAPEDAPEELRWLLGEYYDDAE